MFIGRAAAIHVPGARGAVKASEEIAEDLAKGEVRAAARQSDQQAAKNVNAANALNRKLLALQDAQASAARVETLPDRRVRYYTQEKPARTEGPTREASFVTEYNLQTGDVTQWMESYGQDGNVVRTHLKTDNGQLVDAPHVPPTGSELGQ